MSPHLFQTFAGLNCCPTPSPINLMGHLNYAPTTIGDNVDKWHVDTLRYDYVMFVTDPKKNQGGAFQYYRGTKLWWCMKGQHAAH